MASQCIRFKSNGSLMKTVRRRTPSYFSLIPFLGVVLDIPAPGSAAPAAVECTPGTLPCYHTSSRLQTFDGNMLPLSKPLLEA